MGNLKAEFFDEYKTNFKQCKECGHHSFVPHTSPLRENDCQGCMMKNCSGFRGNKKVKGLYKVLDQLHDFLSGEEWHVE